MSYNDDFAPTDGDPEEEELELGDEGFNGGEEEEEEEEEY